MTIQFNNMNALPVRTWNRLKINETTFSEVIPTIAPLTAPFVPQIPQGVQLLDDIPGSFPEMETSAGPHASGFVQEWANAGLALRAPRKGGSRQPAAIHYCLDENNTAVVDNNIIWAEPESNLTLIQVYESRNGQRGFHAGLTRIVAEAGSHVKIVQVQLMNDVSAHWNDVGIIADENAQVEVVQIEMGAKRALSGCKIVLQGNSSRANVKTFYYGDGTRSLDFNYAIKHEGIETLSDVAASGALFGHCDKTYRSTIDFVSGAARSVGHEGENTLLFSGDCVNRSAPLILCGEENVEGQHAATIGKVDADLLFYLNSRGIPEAQAKYLLVQAQLGTVLQAAPDAPLAERLQKALAERMAAV